MKKTKPNTKSIERSIKHDRESTVSPWMEDYLDCFTFRMKPVSQMFLERIAKELIEWAEKDEDAIKFSQFYAPKRIPRDTFFSWLKKYPVMQQARGIAEAFIANRRELNTLKKKYDPSTNNFMMHYYDPEWKEASKYHAELKSKNESNEPTKIVIMDRYPIKPSKEEEKNDQQ